MKIPMNERILLAVAGNRDVLSELLVEQHDFLLRFLDGKMSADLKGRIEPDDIFQETCVAAFQGIASFQPKSELAFTRWLQTIAENRLRDAARSLNAQKRGGDLEQVPTVVPSDTGSMLNLLEVIAADLSTPSLKVSREESLRELQLQLAALTDDFRQAITLKDLQGLSVEETAAQMNRTFDQVRSLLYHGRRKLAEGMGNSSLYQFRE